MLSTWDFSFRVYCSLIANTFAKSYDSKTGIPTATLVRSTSLNSNGFIICRPNPPIFSTNLVKLCERKINSNTVALHHGWISTIVFGLLSFLEALSRQKSDNQSIEHKPFTRREVWLLVALA